ncbi:LmeA family phospholipid-binding protein [Amycolatopsis anabasis]|uniref:LmeA family phospholipid-binding protein n=1 Tax=Amycolatopsis anabasis TaxID=1840409 RepID=UPI00131C5714|nr:DUF2993 domain-containing protein [Amycolatopsis anabasis]
MVSRPVTQDGRTPRGTTPDSRRRGRRARKIIIVLVVLAGLLVAADFGLAAIAEHAVSQKAREQLKLTDDPSVTIHGFPFSTQAIGGDYRHISIYAAGVPLQDKLRDVELTAELRDVTAPLSDLTSGNTGAIKIGKLEGQVKIKASDIARVEPLTKVENLRIEPASEDYVKTGQDKKETEPTTTANAPDEDDSSAGVRISGNVQIAGQKVEIFCFAMIELDNNTIQFTPERLQFGNDKETTIVPPEVQKALLPNFRASVDVGSLPFKVTPTAVKVESGSVTLKGEAKDVTFAGVTAGR